MRLNVRKTYKLFIGGQFPRSESGRHMPIFSPKGTVLVANVCKASRKDLRNAVVAARKAFSGWAARTTLNRGQILYRLGEMLEARREQFVDELTAMGQSRRAAVAEVEAAVDACIYYAGWADKFTAVLGTVNPVAGPYFNFSFPEPTGVVGIAAPETPALSGMLARVLPAIVSGNTVVVLASESRPLCAITLAEVIATSDIPGGVINILTGVKAEVAPWMAAHMDINAVDLSGIPEVARAELAAAASENVKRVVAKDDDDAMESSLYAIADFLEVKTVWHPVGM